MNIGEKGDKREHSTSEVERFLTGLKDDATDAWGTKAYVVWRVRERFGLTWKRSSEVFETWADSYYERRED